ncbi:solute carrier family 49 member 4 homolog [Pecten maximus]|uniref:solute carrier family 49 member 4 homolog n=1 Tax=Pecten maximus TaxID=6579 RepID=UPI0014582D3E|nr:solute carrier family 49 member 4 homolog [Pecten maximus]
MTSLKPEINPKNTEIEDQRTEGMSEDIQDTTLYRRRWYVLAVYCLYTFSQAGVWNTWGPIAESCKRAFGWDDTIIALLPNWGPIGFIAVGWLTSWSMDTQGLRMSCVVTAVLVAVATAIRCITSEPPYITWTANIAAFLNALGGPVAMGAPPVLSAAWFPPNQRTTSTAIATISNYAGFAASFLIGPLFDSLAPKGQTNMSDSESVTLSSIDNHTVTLIQNTSDANNQGSQEITRIRHDVMLVMYGECGWCVLVMLLILFYFPSKPPTPPSKTASEGRIEIVSGLKQLMRSKMFLLISVIYGLPLGIVGLWGSVMSVTLEPHGVSEAQAGWIGFYSILAGCFGALFMARISDMFSKHMKQILILLFCLAFLCFLWFNLILIGIIPSSIAQIYISVITGTLWINATVPLLFEMACENTYPIAEGLTTVVLTTWLNVVGLIFLGVQMIPKIGTSWESWSILASIGVCIPILCLMGDNYNRLKIDENFEKKTTPVQ